MRESRNWWFWRIYVALLAGLAFGPAWGQVAQSPISGGGSAGATSTSPLVFPQLGSAPSNPVSGIDLYSVNGAGTSVLQYKTPAQTITLPGQALGDTGHAWWVQPMGIYENYTTNTPTDAFRVQTTHAYNGGTAGNVAPSIWAATSVGTAGTPMMQANLYQWPILSTLSTYIGGTQSLTALSWASTGGGQITATTTSPHGVSVGDKFALYGNTPTGYNGTYTAITGTTGSTLVASLVSNPGAETALGIAILGTGGDESVALQATVNNYYQTTAGENFGFNVALNDLSGASPGSSHSFVTAELDLRGAGAGNGTLADGKSQAGSISPGANRRILDLIANWKGIPLSALNWASSQVTATTSVIHSIPVGGTFIISGATPSGYNGVYTAISGTGGTTLIAALASNPGTATVLGAAGAAFEVDNAVNLGTLVGGASPPPELANAVTFKNGISIGIPYEYSALNLQNITPSTGANALLLPALPGADIAWTATQNAVATTFATISGTGASGSESLVLTPAASGNINLNGPIQAGTPGSVNGSLAFAGSTSGDVTVQANATAGTYTMTLPTTAGSSGQFLTSAGGGATAMTWSAATPSQIITTLTVANSTWTVNAATKYVSFFLCGGGGSGGGGHTGASGSGGGSGGGAGCMQAGPYPASAIPSPLTLKYLQGSAGATPGGAAGVGGVQGASIAIEDRTNFTFTLECDGGGGGGAGTTGASAGGGSAGCGAQGPYAASAGNGSGGTGGTSDGWGGLAGTAGGTQSAVNFNSTAGGAGTGGSATGNNLGGHTAGTGGSGGGAGGAIVASSTGGDSGVTRFNFNVTGTTSPGVNGVCGGYIGGSGGAGGGGSNAGAGQAGGNGACGGGGGGGGGGTTGAGAGGNGAAAFVTIVEQ